MFEISPRRPLAAVALVFACSSSALAQTAQPSILPTQGLRPLAEEWIQNGSPADPNLGFDVAMRDNLAITSMPDYGFNGSQEPGGRVAVWTRNSGGSWQRSGTIDALPDGGRFGETMALGSDRAFISSGGNALRVATAHGSLFRLSPLDSKTICSAGASPSSAPHSSSARPPTIRIAVRSTPSG